MTHPATVWALMKRGMSLHQIAAQRGGTVGELDRALWAWLCAR